MNPSPALNHYHSRTVLALDLDNTVYDFVSFYGKAVRAMASVVEKQLKIDRSSVEDQFRRAYRRAGTVDFRNLVQNLDLSLGLSDDVKSKLIRNVRRAYDLTKRKRLRSYANLLSTLGRVEAAGVSLVVVTNAPVYHAYTRLRDVGALPYLYGLVAWSGPDAEESDYPRDEHIAHTHQVMLSLAYRTLPFVATFDRLDRKPSSYPFELVKSRFGDAAYFAVGDSISKDLAPAAKLGMHTIWARYGTQLESQRDLDTLLNMTPWSSEEIGAHFEEVFSPDYIIDDPRGLLSILPHYDQLDLFDVIE